MTPRALPSLSRIQVGMLAVLLASSLLIWSCGGDTEPSAADDCCLSSSGSLSGELTIFAAASLTESFKEVGAAFEALHPDVDISFNFVGTPTLRTQLEQGARADVFASADRQNMSLARHAGVVNGEPDVFVRNSLVIIVPSDNPAGISQPADLGRAGLKLVLANSQVPVGGYSRQMLDLMSGAAEFGPGFVRRVLANLVSEESDVKQVVAKVQLGEVDAGVVYGTDVTPDLAARLVKIEVPLRFNVVADYPIALTSEARNPEAGREFIRFVMSDEAQAIFKKFGFQTLDQTP